MPSKPAKVRTLRLPPPDLAAQAIPRLRLPAGAWYRVHHREAGALTFGLHAHHRFSHPDSTHPFLYLGSDMPTCLWERFGDVLYDGCHTVSRQLWADTVISEIRVPELKVCDLTNDRTRSAMMVDMTALMSHELSVPQAWSLVLQRHPAGFQALKYSSRFNERPCLALFGAGNLPGRLVEKRLGPLSGLDPAAEWLEAHQVCLV
jgi:hypothetical protein